MRNEASANAPSSITVCGRRDKPGQLGLHYVPEWRWEGKKNDNGCAVFRGNNDTVTALVSPLSGAAEKISTRHRPLATTEGGFDLDIRLRPSCKDRFLQALFGKQKPF